ncbi:MAG: DUF1799 domain-containing protein [Pseudomonadota bacterium]
MMNEASRAAIAARSAQASASSQPDFEIFYNNWLAWGVFQACTTQWRIAPMGGYTGLDYTAVHSVMTTLGIAKKKRSSHFNRLRYIEAGAMAEMAEQRKRAEKKREREQQTRRRRR